MKNSSEIKGKNILLLGYGRENQSVHRFLLTRQPDAHIAIADKNPITPVALVANQKIGATYLSGLESYDTVVRSPGIPPTLPELEIYKNGGGNITTGTNIFFSLCRGKTIGVTGTKGKSTTASLVAHILRSSYADVRLAGNIGNPMLDELESSDENTIFVLELSSHQLIDSGYSPNIAVFLNVVPEHFDYYQTLARYAQAKANIITFQKPNDAVVSNPGHDVVESLIKKSGKSTRHMFSQVRLEGAVVWQEGGVIMRQSGGVVEPVVAVSDIPLKGNEENILASVTVGTMLGVTASQIRTQIMTFQALPHRLEFVGEFKGVRFYNDSLATIPEATIHALEALGPDVETLIAGGLDRGLDYKTLSKYLGSQKYIKILILFPDTGRKIWEAVKAARARPVIQKFYVKSMKEAVKLAYQHTHPGKICLLSPASASFNLFKDYADRGEQFKHYIKYLGSGI